MRAVAECQAQEILHALCGFKGLTLREVFFQCTPGNFQQRVQLCVFGGAHAVDRRELLLRGMTQPREGPEVREQFAGEVDGAFAWHAHAQEDG